MKVSIDTPCHENWEAMQPNNEGAHCFSCQKSVIDFSQKSTHEIKLFFSSIADSQKICGRFKPEQLKELSFDDFFEKFKKWVLPHKLAVILVFTFGLGLFSCDTNSNSNHLMGEVVSNQTPTDTISQVDTARANTKIGVNKNSVIGQAKVIAAPVTQTISPKTNNTHEQKYLKGDVAYVKDTITKKICIKKDSVTKQDNTEIMGRIMRSQ